MHGRDNDMASCLREREELVKHRKNRKVYITLAPIVNTYSRILE